MDYKHTGEDFQGSSPHPHLPVGPPYATDSAAPAASACGFFPGGSLTPAETVSISIGVGAPPDLERSHATILRPLLLGSSLNAA